MFVQNNLKGRILVTKKAFYCSKVFLNTYLVQRNNKFIIISNIDLYFDLIDISI